MYKLLTSKGQLFALLLGVACIAIFLISVFSGLSSAGYSTSDDLNSIMKNNPDADFSFFDIGVHILRALIFIALAAAVIFGLMHIIRNPKGSLKGIIAVAAIVGLFFILSQASAAENTGIIGDLVQSRGISESVSKYISGGIKTVGILSFGAIAFMVLSEIWNLFK